MSPVMGIPLPSKQLVPNIVLRQLVRHHFPNWQPWIPVFSRVSVKMVELMLSYLDGCSLARVQSVSADFMALSSLSALWAYALVAEFGVDVSSLGQEEVLCSPWEGPQLQFAFLQREWQSHRQKKQVL